MRLKLVCIGVVLILVLTTLCSFVKANDQRYPPFCVEFIGSQQGIRMYKITVDGETYTVIGSNYMKSMTVLK
jgi:hypothetical protein